MAVKKPPAPNGDKPDPVQKQITELLDPKRPGRVITLLRQRHHERFGSFTMDILRERGREPMMIVQGEIILRAKDAPRAARGLGRQFSIEPIPGDDRARLVRLRANVGAAKLADAIRTLRAHCIDASPNGVAAFGMRSKAGVTAEPTTSPVTLIGPAGAGKGAHVVIIDTGIALTAKSRNDNLLAGIAINAANTDRLTAINQAVQGVALLDAAAGHGTFVAGVVRQVAPKSKITMIRALDSDGVGTELDVRNALIMAAQLKPHVINMSFGAESLDNQPPVALSDAVAQVAAISPGTVLVAAAGNSPDSVRTWPSTLPGVTSVAGLNAAGQPSSWSKRGSWINVSAIGEGVVSGYVTGTESIAFDPNPDTWSGTDPVAVWIGTSFATPRVAGAIAAGVANGLTPKDALAKLIAGGTTVPDWGVVLAI